MMKDRHDKGLSRNNSTKPVPDRTATLRYEMCPPQVADSPNPAWKKYCDSRLRTFGTGR